jgi:hypothetical protein
VYRRPLTLKGSATLKAAAFAADGRGRSSWRSATVTATYTTMSLAKGGLFLSDLPEQDLAAYLPCWKKDTNHLGKPIRIAGVEYPKGLLLHPEEGKDANRGSVVYLLAGELRKAKRFTAVIGIDDAMHTYKKGSATFAVEVRRKGHWEGIFESGVMRLGDPSREAKVDIAGAEAVRLVTGDGGDGIACDHAEWAVPKLE